MRRCLAILLTTTFLAPAAWAEGFVQSPAYKECTALAASNPEQALVKADEWLKVDTSYAAYHCRAMALYGLSRFGEAAEVLGYVRGKIPPENISLRTYVTRQGAKAWVSAGQPDAALSLIGAQINEMSTAKNDNATEGQLSADLLLDRARLNARYGKAVEAVQDLDHAISLSPLNEQVLFLRAQCFEQLGDIPLAKQDLSAVLRLNPKHADATAMLQRLNTL